MSIGCVGGCNDCKLCKIQCTCGKVTEEVGKTLNKHVVNQENKNYKTSK